MNKPLEDVKALLIEGVQGGIVPNEVSPLALAYIGDAIYEIFVRTMVLSKGNAPVNKLHKQSREYVNANRIQADAPDSIVITVRKGDTVSAGDLDIQKQNMKKGKIHNH